MVLSELAFLNFKACWTLVAQDAAAGGGGGLNGCRWTGVVPGGYLAVLVCCPKGQSDPWGLMGHLPLKWAQFRYEVGKRGIHGWQSWSEAKKSVLLEPIMLTAVATVNLSVTSRFREHLAMLQAVLERAIFCIISFAFPTVSRSRELLSTPLLQVGMRRHSKVEWLVLGNIVPE